MRHFTKAAMALITGMVVMTNINISWAQNPFGSPFGGSTGRLHGPGTKIPPASYSLTKVKKRSSQPVIFLSLPKQYVFDKYGYKFELPERWKQQMADATGSSVMFLDELGNKGSFQVNTTQIAADASVDAALETMAQQYEARVKQGELEKYYRKDFTLQDKDGQPVKVFQGYVIVEASASKETRRMQWIGYAKDTTINFTWASKPEQFETYRPEFEKILNTIQFI
jgi:hypothetical protein